MGGGRIGRSTSREAAVREHERLFDSRALGNSQLTMTLFRSRHHHVRFVTTVTTSSHRRHNATQLLTKPANIRLDYRIRRVLFQLSRVSTLTLDIDIAILSVRPSVRHVPVLY